MKRRFDHDVEVATGGAAPPSAVIAAMEAMGFRVTHLYGLTESYGPATLCAWQDEWDDAAARRARARCMARQGVRYPTLEDVQRRRSRRRCAPVPARRRHAGRADAARQHGDEGLSQERRGHARRPSRGGWFHTGDLAVLHPDGYVEIKDRSKDIIISGGENISSLEVEEVPLPPSRR